MALKPEAAARKDKATGIAPMQHRHFASIAAILADMDGENCGVSRGQHSDICDHFARHLATSNPKFDRDRFLTACGAMDSIADKITDSVNAQRRTRTTSKDGSYFIKARNIIVGDRLDLEGDDYADPDGDGTGPDGHFYAFDMEYALVEHVEHESDESILIQTSLGSFAFPHDHEIEVAAEGGLPAFYECGICGHVHVPGFTGDCRDDDHRFTWSEIEKNVGKEGKDWLRTDQDGRKIV